MDRTEAVTAAQAIIDAFRHEGATHLRLLTTGSFAGTPTVTVETLARVPGQRPKGTRERVVARSSDPSWLAWLLALKPTFTPAYGCAERRGFDVSYDGDIIPFRN